MNLSIENILLVGSILLVISILAGRTSYRFGVPTLILFLGVGILAGSEGIGGIHFDDPSVARFIGVVSLNFILFSGGLDTNWSSIKHIFWQGFSLSTLGVLLTAISMGTFVWAVTDFSIYEGLLLGAIVSSTDAAAVFSILRSKKLALKSRLRPMLEFESGSNDPMAYVLTIAFLTLVLNPQAGVVSVIPMFFQQMGIGAVAGLLFGKLSKTMINRLKLDFEGLYPVLVIGLMFLTFSATNFVQGNGFLAVYICAVYLSNHDLIHKKTILKVFDGLAWLFQIVLFLTLGLLVFPSEIIPVMGTGLLISAFLMIVARPLSVILSLIFFRMKLRERVYVCCVGLRGAVPIVFATYPLLAGIDKADMIFNIVFFVSVSSVLVQGTSLGFIARKLRVVLPERVKRRQPADLILSEEAKTCMAEVVIPKNGYAAGKKVVDLHFPPTAIIAMLKRGDKYITPSGDTVIKAGDRLTILSETRDGLSQVYKSLGI